MTEPRQDVRPAFTFFRARRAVPWLAALLLLACDGAKSPQPPPAPVPSGPTQEEIDRLRLLHEAADRELAERKKRRDAMRAMGTATVTKKTQIGKDKDVKIELVFEFKNVGTKELAAAEGAMEFRDASGEVLKNLKIPFLGPIKPGDTSTKTGKFPVDPGKPGDVSLVKTPLAEIHLNWVPQLYRFADGTSERGE
jgi:hypothetical protein